MSAEVQLDLPQPTQLSRAHLLVRLLIAMVLGVLTRAVGWPGGVLYLVLPAFAAIRVSQHGPVRYLGSDGPRLVRLLDWLLGFLAYMALLTDDLPTADRMRVRCAFVPAGAPDVASVALRIFTSIPAALVTLVLSFVGGILVLVQMVFVLVVQHYPRPFFEYQAGLLRVQARLLAYHASLTDTYPSLSFHAPQLARAA
jgi:hypothetical protein